MDTADYREQALKLFPRLSGRCGREFNGKNLRGHRVHIHTLNLAAEWREIHDDLIGLGAESGLQKLAQD